MKNYIILAATALLIAGCGGKGEVCGTYQGTLPAADGPGIDTSISFHQDKTFSEKLVYIGKKDGIFSEKGKFSIGGNIITAQNSNGETSYYLVEKDQIRRLDGDRKPITGDLANYYILKQTMKCK